MAQACVCAGVMSSATASSGADHAPQPTRKSSQGRKIHGPEDAGAAAGGSDCGAAIGSAATVKLETSPLCFPRAESAQVFCTAVSALVYCDCTGGLRRRHAAMLKA